MRSARQHGFTLVELMMTVAVFVVLTLIGIVAYSSVVLLERVVLKWRPKLTGTA